MTELLSNFAQETLRILEEHEDWNPGVLDAIAQYALELGLAEADESGMFKRRTCPGQTDLRCDEKANAMMNVSIALFVPPGVDPRTLYFEVSKDAFTFFHMPDTHPVKVEGVKVIEHCTEFCEHD